MEKAPFCIEDFRVDLERLDDAALPLFDDLIGRRHIANMLLGALPQERSDVLVQLYNKNAAFLFAGREGNGKRTFATAFACEMCDRRDFDGTLFRYYALSASRLKGNNFEDTCENIEALTAEIKKLCDETADNSTLIYITLGNIDRLVKKKRAAHFLAKKIGELKAYKSAGDKQSTCIFVAYCHKNMEELPPCVREAFVVLPFDSPDIKTRTQYFQRMQEHYLKLAWDMTSEEMAQETDGFTFFMLEQVFYKALLLIKGVVSKSEMSLNDYLSQGGFSISREEILFIIENTKRQVSRQMIEIPQAVYADTSKVAPEASVQQNAILNEADDSELKVKPPESFKEIKEMADSLIKPNLF